MHTLTGTLTVLPVELKETSRGQVAKSPDKEVSTCSVRVVSNSDVFLAIPCIVLISFGAMRIAKLFVVQPVSPYHTSNRKQSTILVESQKRLYLLFSDL